MVICTLKKDQVQVYSNLFIFLACSLDGLLKEVPHLLNKLDILIEFIARFGLPGWLCVGAIVALVKCEL